MLNRTLKYIENLCKKNHLFLINSIDQNFTILSFDNIYNRRNVNEEALVVLEIGFEIVNIVENIRYQGYLDYDVKIGIHTVSIML